MIISRKYQSMLDATLKDMPINFTSEAFSKRMQIYSVPQHYADDGGMRKWLRVRVYNVSRKRWTKVNPSNIAIDFAEKTEEQIKELNVNQPNEIMGSDIEQENETVLSAVELTEEECIRFLKKRNYKVYKQVLTEV